MMVQNLDHVFGGRLTAVSCFIYIFCYIKVYYIIISMSHKVQACQEGCKETNLQK